MSYISSDYDNINDHFSSLGDVSSRAALIQCYSVEHFIDKFPVTVFQINFSVDGMLCYRATWAAPVCFTLIIFLYAQDIEAIFCNKKITHDECNLITNENEDNDSFHIDFIGYSLSTLSVRGQFQFYLY